MPVVLNIFLIIMKNLKLLKKLFLTISNIVEEPDRAEYGDFQTNSDLAIKVTLHLFKTKYYQS